MSTFSIFKSTLNFQFLIFLLPTQLVHLTLATGNPNFDPQIAILGDAKVSDNGSFMHLTNPYSSSSGLLFYKDPFKFLGSSAGKMTSFSTEFGFSFPGNAPDLSLIMGPFNFASKFLGQGPIDVSNENSFLGVEFGASMDGNGGNSSNVLVSVTVNNGPSTALVFKSGEKLNSWVDFDSSSKRLEIRLSKLGDKRPYDPVISCFIDLFKVWHNKEVFVALGSRNSGNSIETCNVYSWRFTLRKIPNWMHSLPVDPHGLMNDNSNEKLKVRRKRLCPLEILGGMLFATGCGALVAFVVLFVWAILVHRRTSVPIEGKVLPINLKYEKIDVVVEEKDEKVVKN